VGLARGLFAVGAAGIFVFYYPLLAAVAIPQPAWNSRIAIFDHCQKPTGRIVTSTISTTINGKKTTRQTTSDDNANLPPTGWCWI
jgi:hypothetical protein